MTALPRCVMASALVAVLLCFFLPLLSATRVRHSVSSPAEAPAAAISLTVQSAADAAPLFHLVPPGGTQRPTARLQLTLTNSLGADPPLLTSLLLNLSASTSLTDVTAVSAYWSALSFDYSGLTLIAQAKLSPSSPTLTLNASRALPTGTSYLWLTVDLSPTAVVGHSIAIAIEHAVIDGQTLFPHNPPPTLPVVVASPTLFSSLSPAPVSVVSSFAASAASGTNFVSFQQSAIMTWGGYQYLVYWNRRYHLCLTRRTVSGGSEVSFGAWDELEFWDYRITPGRVADGHYDISVGICAADGSIHLAFDMHADPLRYRVSVPGLAINASASAWSNSSFSATRSYLIPSTTIQQVTYPRFIQRPDGNLQFETRLGSSGSGDNWLWVYNATRGGWTVIGKYGDGRSLRPTQNAYVNGVHYRHTRLHVSWCWRVTPDPETDHDLQYGYSDDDGYTWYNGAGVQVAEVNTHPMTLNTTGLKVVFIGQNRGLINQESQVVDSTGHIHILASYLLDTQPNSTNFWAARTPTATPGSGAMLRHLYQRADGVWVNQVIGAATENRAQIAIDGEDGVYVVAPNYRVFYAAKEKEGGGWGAWTVVDYARSVDGINEGLIDRELLLTRNVLAFAFATADGRVLVPSYHTTRNSSRAD